MAKCVEVLSERTQVYNVDGSPTDEEAIDIVKRRLQAEMPLDILKDETHVKKFVVKDVCDVSSNAAS